MRQPLRVAQLDDGTIFRDRNGNESLRTVGNTHLTHDGWVTLRQKAPENCSWCDSSTLHLRGVTCCPKCDSMYEWLPEVAA